MAWSYHREPGFIIFYLLLRKEYSIVFWLSFLVSDSYHFQSNLNDNFKPNTKTTNQVYFLQPLTFELMTGNTHNFHKYTSHMPTIWFHGIKFLFYYKNTTVSLKICQNNSGRRFGEESLVNYSSIQWHRSLELLWRLTVNLHFL